MPFENDQAVPSGGVPGLLEPLNTVEQKQVQREEDNLALFYALKLTEQNVSSLVFQRVETEAEPSVIFVADFTPRFCIDKPVADFPNHLKPVGHASLLRPTTAHATTIAPTRCSRTGSEPTSIKRSYAVRTGGMSKQTLEGYLDVTNRRCAQCYQCHGGNWSQLVAVATAGSDWSIGRGPQDHGGVCGTIKQNRSNAKFCGGNSSFPLTRGCVPCHTEAALRKGS